MHGTYRGVEVALDHGDAGQQVALQDEGELEEALDASVEDLLIRPLHQAGHTLPSILLLTWVFLMNLRQAMHCELMMMRCCPRLPVRGVGPCRGSPAP